MAIDDIRFVLPRTFKVTSNKMHIKHLVRCLVYIAIVWNCQRSTAPHRKTVCLNMIVKNEVDVIRRCLASCKPLIDCWVIVDTGSTDGTQDAIREFMADIPGVLYNRPWVNFEHNRNEALMLANGKSDYVLTIDADDTFRYDPGFKLQNLDKDYYFMAVVDSSCHYKRIHLFANNRDFRWTGVVHEQFVAAPLSVFDMLDGICYVRNYDGGRSKDPQKYDKDALVLEAALVDDPNNARYIFYLAQSYRDAQNYAMALTAYQRRIDVGDASDEVFWSLLHMTNIQWAIKHAPQNVEAQYWTAFNFRPHYAESLYYLCRYYKDIGDYEKWYTTSKRGLGIAVPKHALFCAKPIYDWALALEHSVAAWMQGKHTECFDLSNKILNQPDLPQNIRETVTSNLQIVVGQAC